MDAKSSPETVSNGIVHDKKPSIREIDHASNSGDANFDPHRYYYEQAGRLVVSPEEARVEFGERVANCLKLSVDGTKVLWPQPTDDPNDPQNWTGREKALQLLIIILAAIVPDFQGSIGIAALFGLAREFNTSTGNINNLTSNWNIFLLGWGGVFAVMLTRRYGRLPVLFWSLLIAEAFMAGATFAPNLAGFAGFRILNGFFSSCPQVTGLYVITDMYPFHLQARMLNTWTMGFIVAPFLGPCAMGFVVARTGSWRWAYGVGALYGAVVFVLVALFMRETVYNRRQARPAISSSTNHTERLRSLVGIAGWRTAHSRDNWKEILLAPLNVVWRPQILGVLIFEGVMFGFSIGINVTNAVFLGEPKPFGFGLGPYAIAGMYATPIVAVIIGELIGRFTNDAIMEISVRQNGGVFEAESRLWSCYIGMPLYVCGFLVLGAALEHRLGLAGVIFGWGIVEVAIMVNTVAVYAYCNNCFPRHQGEISALINLARVFGGFAIAYFQVPWSLAYGALRTFAIEAAISVALFLVFVPRVQLRGRALRKRYGLH